MKPNPLSAWLGSAAAAAVVLFSTATGGAAEKPALPPLTTVSGSPRLPGKFVWADLVTDDVKAATQFYAGLFGWRFNDYGGYVIGLNDERPMCGMFQRPKPTNTDAKPRWFGYISVASVASAQKIVTKAGGKVLAAPQKMPKRGEQAVFADPEGAIFGVVKSSAGDPADFLADPGDWIWIELLSRDAAKATEFYRAVGSYDVIPNTASNRLSDYVLSSKGYARATVGTVPSKYEQVKPNWLLFVRVKSVTESLAQAKELGGKVLIAPKAEVFNGKVAVIGDPTGAAVGIMEWSEDLLKGGK